MEPIIKVENLDVIFDQGTPRETYGLRNINLSIFPQEYLIFFGPSGCGKSTLLYTVSGLLAPTNGRAIVKEKNLSELNSFQLALYHRKGMGMVFQQYNLIPSLNVIDNVALPMIWSGISKSERNKKAKQLLDRFGLGGYANRLIQELSGGQQQRVAIARSLVNDPPIIFADEPVGNLDSVSAKVVLGILSELNEKDKKTIILVTHDSSYFPYAHRVIFIKDGMIIKEEKNYNKISATTVVAKDVASLRLARYKEFSVDLADYFLVGGEKVFKERLSELIFSKLKGDISWQILKEELLKPILENGLNFILKKSEDLIKELQEILYEFEFLKDKTENDLRREGLDSEIKELRKYLLTGFAKPLTIIQILRLEETIEDYVRGISNEQLFKKVLILPLIQNGVGLTETEANQLVKKLSLIVEQIR